VAGLTPQVYECLLAFRPPAGQGTTTPSIWRHGRGSRRCPSNAVAPADFSPAFGAFLSEGTTGESQGGPPVYEVPALRRGREAGASTRPSARGLLRGHSRAWSLHAASHYKAVLEADGAADGAADRGGRGCEWGDGALAVLAHYAATSVAPKEGIPPRCPAAPDALRAADRLRCAARIALARGRGNAAAAAALGLLRRAGFLLDLAVAGASSADSEGLAAVLGELLDELVPLVLRVCGPGSAAAAAARQWLQHKVKAGPASLGAGDAAAS
jgi:hypothetical protein